MLRMKKKVKVFFLLILFYGILFGEITGYFKTFFFYSEDKIQEKKGFFDNEKFRIKFRKEFSENLSFFSEVEATFYKNSSLNLNELTSSIELEWRVFDSSVELFNQSSRKLSIDFDRFFLDYSKGKIELIAGRQVVSWGSSKVVNPTDIYSPFSFNAIDREERRGVDALRVRYSLGDFSELDFGFVFGDKFKRENSSFFSRLKGSFNSVDYSLLFILKDDERIYGLDFNTTLGGNSLWLEASYSEGDSINFLRFTGGIDYNFNIGSGVYTFLEYHYNGCGEKEPSIYFKNYIENQLYYDGIYLMGKNYLFLGVSFNLHPLVYVSSIGALNIDDGSYFTFESIEYNFFENGYFGGGFLYGGGKGVMVYESGILYLNSEFSVYPNILFLYIKYYF